MKTIHLNKSTDNRVFYSVAGSIQPNSAIMNRGIFQKRKDAKDEAVKYAYSEIWRHEDKNGKRISNKLIGYGQGRFKDLWFD